MPVCYLCLKYSLALVLMTRMLYVPAAPSSAPPPPPAVPLEAHPVDESYADDIEVR